jgi:ubiquinone/menaquinone biosynthesis C-methylase UbiE
MPGEGAAFWSAVADRYDRVVDRQIGGATRAMVRERVEREGRLGRVVELGCGTGFFTEVLARKANTLLATDVAPGMLAVARARVTAPHVTFQVEDCERTSLPDAAADTAFLSLVLHFTEPARVAAEMRRILRTDGALLIANLDPEALGGIDRVRSMLRVLYCGVLGYRLKPPKRFGRNVLTERRLRALLEAAGFRIEGVDTVRDASRASSIPIEYVRARAVGAG